MPDERTAPWYGGPGDGLGKGDTGGGTGAAGGRIADQPTVTALPSAGGPPSPYGPAPHAPAPHAPAPHAPAPYGPGPYGPGPGGQHGHGYGPGPGPGWVPPPPPPSTSGICVAALVLGVVGAFLVTTIYFAALAVLVGPVAIGLGISARRRVKRGEAHGSGPATAGLVLGIVSTVIGAVVVGLIVLVLALGGGGESGDDWREDDGTFHARPVAGADRNPDRG